MLGLITAAGRGSRMGALSARRHKGLSVVGGRPLLHHILDALAEAGVDPTYVVTGYRRQSVEQAVGERGACLFNPFFDVSGILGSFWQAMPYLDGQPFLFTTVDHFFEPALVEQCMAAGGDMSVLIEQRDEYDAEDSKVSMENGRIVRFGKDIPLDEASGEFSGMVCFSSMGSSTFFKTLRRRFHGVDRNMYAMDLFNDLIRQRLDIRTSICGPGRRIEIDSVADLRRARTLAKRRRMTQGATR